jgi:hypothetical protein
VSGEEGELTPPATHASPLARLRRDARASRKSAENCIVRILDKYEGICRCNVESQSMKVVDRYRVVRR